MKKLDIVVIQTIEKLGGLSKLTLHEKEKIYELFPIPCEQKILWADVNFARRITGIVLTDVGFFLKGVKLVNVFNKKNSKYEDVKENVYHYIRWEYFDIKDFEIKTDNNSITFGNEPIFLTSEGIHFFECYKNEYDQIIKLSAVVADNIFASVEAVAAENFAYVNNKAGFGKATEEALTLLDKLSGKDAVNIGGNNEKNGADRMVDGVYIQTKYYKTGKGCIDACFDKTTGNFRYIDKNGNIMQIEVPKDKYAEAVNAFRKKILEGKIPGVTNPDDASKYIKQGRLTYKQAVNLSKPGTIESLTYDAATGIVNCSFALGITFLITFVFSYTQSGDRNEAMKTALAAGIQVFGLSFFAHILTQQVARTTLTKQLIPLSDYLVKKMGYKAVQTIVNAIRAVAGKGAISGAAAMKQLSKIFRSNVVVNAITFIVFSVPNTYDMFGKKISEAQYMKNMISLIATMLGGGGGVLAASIAAAKISGAAGTIIAPGLGTVIGIGGGAIGGLFGGAIIKALGDAVREDDSVILSRMFNGVAVNLIYEYMLQQSEINELIEKFDNIKSKEFIKLFKSIHNAQNQEKIIEDFIRHYYESIIHNRVKVNEPTPKELVELIELMAEENKDEINN